MNIWPVQEAKARFSQLVKTCICKGPQMITHRGEETAVLVPITEWKHLQHIARPSLKELLLSDGARLDLPLPSRTYVHRRLIEKL